jgi:S-layer homology domain
MHHMLARCHSSRRWWLVALIAFDVISMSGMPAARAAPALSDVGNDIAEKPAIESMVAQGIMRLRAPGEFAPTTPETKADFAFSLQRLFSLPLPQRFVAFPDIPATSPDYAAVEASAPYLNVKVLCFGCLLGKNFLPNAVVSRAVSTVAIVRALDSQGKIHLPSPADAQTTLANVADKDSLPPAAWPFFAAAITNRILSLQPGNMIAPALPLTRAATAAQLDLVQKTFVIPRLSSP